MHREQIVKWKIKPTSCNSYMFIINTFSTCFGHHYAHLQETKTCVTARGVLHCNKRGKSWYLINVFFGVYSVINLDVTSCVYANVLCQWVCRGVNLYKYWSTLIRSSHFYWHGLRDYEIHHYNGDFRTDNSALGICVFSVCFRHIWR